MATSDYPTPRRSTNMWAAGFVVFAGAMMIMLGIFEAITGLAAIFENEFFVVTPNYVFDLDVTAWGWIHLLLGVIVGFAGYGVFTGAVWARSIGVLVALLTAVANFFYIPYYPVWSIVLIALSVLVIWALCVWNREEARGAGL